MKCETGRRMLYGNKDLANVIKGKYELEALIKPKGRPKKAEHKNRTDPISWVPVTLDSAQAIGADGYAPDAAQAIKIGKELLNIS